MLIHDLDTPALLVDVDVLDRNIQGMMEFLGDGPCGLRPPSRSRKRVFWSRAS